MRKYVMTILIAFMAIIFGGGTALAVPAVDDTTSTTVEVQDDQPGGTVSETERSDSIPELPDNLSLEEPTAALADRLTFNVAGAGSAGLVPKGRVPHPLGGLVEYVQYSADALDMTNSAAEGAQKLLEELTPGEDGVCRIEAYSLGTVATVKALDDIIAKLVGDGKLCESLDVTLAGSPNGAGSIATLLPDNFLIVFNEADLSDFVSDDVAITVVNMASDGYGSCLNRLSSIVGCVAGMFTGHYCAVADLVPGQCYADYVGEWREYTVDGVHYRTADTRNPVAVLTEAGGKLLLGDDFGLSPLADKLFEAAFPQGTPGFEQRGITPRESMELLQSMFDLVG